MRILVTRPERDAEATAARLRKAGHEVLIAPLLEVRFLDGAELALEGVQALVVTSANGARAVARRTSRRDIAIFAVGTQTAQAAREAGFADMRNSTGDAAELADAIAGWTSPEQGMLIHATGNHAAGKLQELLTRHGFSVRREILYEAVEPGDFPAAVKQALADAALDAVLLYSPRSAEIFARYVQKNGLAQACENLLAVCISAAAGEAAGRIGFREIRVATRPDEENLLARLQR